MSASDRTSSTGSGRDGPSSGAGGGAEKPRAEERDVAEDLGVMATAGEVEEMEADDG
jgi:hypothetical protein